MSQPAKAPETKVPEPSIDEILASIRRSIVPDDDAGKSAARKSGARRAAQPASAGAKSRRAASESTHTSEDGAGSPASPSLDQPPEGESRIDDVDPGSDENNVSGHRGDAAAIGAGEAPAAGPPAPNSPLLSPRTTAAVDVAFNSLTNTMLSQNPRTLEDLVREMLKPMLKAWLDAHLPDMVERLVRAEIERVSRRGERE